MSGSRLHLLLPLAFVLIAGQLGLFLALTVPVGQVPDEHNHAMRADGLLRGEWLGHRAVARAYDGAARLQSGVDADTGLLLVEAYSFARPLTQARWAAMRAQPWLKPNFQPMGSIASYWPVFYLPAAAGLGVAKLVGLRPLGALLVGRLVNLTLFLALGLTALLVARRGQTVLFCALAMPMTLHLAASFNQDGLIIASSALAVALLTLPPPPTAPSRDVARLLAAALLGSVALAKPPYLPLVGLLLLPLPPWRAGRLWLRRLALVLALVTATLGWSWLAVRIVATPMYWGAAEAGPLWPGARPAMFLGTDLAAQLQVLLAKPTRLWKLPWRSLRLHGGIVDEAIGRLAYLDVWLPRPLYQLWKLALLAAPLADATWRRQPASPLPWPQLAVPPLLVVLAWLGIELSQYLSWTPVGADFIGGAEGRYLLPLLPALALAVPSCATLPRLRAALTMVPVAACLAGAALVPGIIIGFFYMQ